jgi:general secretion pathway protein G
LKKQNKGFTLIELLVVIAIIVILAGIVIFAVNTARVKARDAQRITNLEQIKLALELYADDHSSSYPTTTSDLVPKYLQALPQDPSTAVDYAYACNNTLSPKAYQIAALLENTDNAGLKTDSDINTTTGGDWAVQIGCGNAPSGINGTDPMYDLGIK